MDKAGATIHLNDLARNSAVYAPFHGRAIALLKNPDGLMQGAFGVCGMTSIVRSLLRLSDLTRFVQLVDAVFIDAPFNGIQAPPGRLLVGRIKQFNQKDTHRRVVGGNLPNPAHELDFILARSLGKLLKVTAPLAYSAALQESSWMTANFKAKPGSAANVLCELDPSYAPELDSGTISDKLAHDLRFHDLMAQLWWGFGIDTTNATVTTVTVGSEWEITLSHSTIPDGKTRTLSVTAVPGGKLEVSYDAYGEPGAFQKDGDLGVGPTGMMWLMKDVIGAQSHTFDYNFGDGSATAKVNATLGRPDSFVYAFVDSTTNWSNVKNGRIPGFEVPATPHQHYVAKPPPTGTHIVVVTGQITEDATHVHVPVWTWGRAFTADIPKKHLAGYIKGYSHGQL